MVTGEKTPPVCCFSGHRDIVRGTKRALALSLLECIEKLVTEQGVQRFYVGGAVGFDALAAKAVIYLRKSKYPQLRLVLAVPFEGHYLGWPQEKQAEYAEIKAQADEYVAVSLHPSKSAFLARNRYMVDHSEICVVYLRHSGGGSEYTAAYARRNGKEIIRI